MRRPKGRSYRFTRWSAVSALVLTVGACGKDAPTVSDGTQAPRPLFDVTPQVLNCMGDDAVSYPGNVSGFSTDPTDFNCTANDIRIANARTSSGDPITCVQGQQVSVDIVADVTQTSTSERTDIGIWIGKGASAETGECSFFYFQPPFTPPVQDLDGSDGNPGDQCGDLDQAAVVVDFPLDAVTFTCTDPDGDGFVAIPSCVSWTQPGGDRVCPAAVGGARAGTLPATKSKCNCEPFLVPIIIQGTITIVKNTVGGNGTFDFTTTGTGFSNFNLTTVGGTAQQSFTLNPGNYSVTESGPGTGWQFTSLQCTTGGTVSSQTATIVLPSGGNVTCTYTNTRQSILRIAKATDPDGDATAFTFTPTGGWNGGNTFTRADNQPAFSSGFVAPGTYGATETVPSGWALTGRACVLTGTATAKAFTSPANGVSVTLAAGEDVTCTFTDTKQVKLRIAKVTDPDGDPTAFTFTPTGGWNGGNTFTRADNQAAFESAFLAPGTYGATETVPSGWALATRACVLTGTATPKTFTEPANGVSVTLAAGEDVTCTFTNTKQAILRIAKATNPDGDATDFTFTPTGGWNGGSTFTRADNQAAFASGFLAPGTYGATETVPTGWALTGRACVLTGTATPKTFTEPANGVSVTLAAGEDVTCTFTDTKQAILRIAKSTLPDGDATDFTFTPTGGWNGGSTFTRADNQAAFASGFLTPGTYGATETVPTGWALTGRACVLTGTATAHAFTSPANGVSVELAAGEDVTCTFTDTKQAILRIAKATDPDGDATAFTFTPTGGWNGGNTFTRADNQAAFASGYLAPGTYGATETVPSGWALTNRACVLTGTATAHAFSSPTNGVSVELAAGEDVTCTFTDTKQATLRIEKATDPDGDATAFTFTPTGGWNGGNTFTRTDNQAAFSSGFLTPGTYGATETVPSGWALTNRACVHTVGGAAKSFTTPSNGVSVALAAGEDITCTFTDTRLGTITIVKTAVGADATFGFTHDVGSNSNPVVGSPFNIITVALTGSQVFSNVFPGTYTVTETTLPTFWEFTSLSCTTGGSGAGQVATIVLPAGGNITCTFTNTFNPPALEGRMTGGGQQVVVNEVDGSLVTISRGFTIHCDIVLSNNLEINWKGNKWHIAKPLTTAECYDDPLVLEPPPVAGFDRFDGTGTGRLNGVDGSLIVFTFIDHGEPGKDDEAYIKIWAPGGELVLHVPLSKLTRGNIQAHEDQPHK